MEIWTQFAASPRGIVKVAAEAEAQGWDGLAVVDSQNLSGDPFVALAMAATATEKLKLATAVSNPVTRMAAAAACSIASVDVVSRGRAVFGVGRGDSALAHVGRSPARLAAFERFLRQTQSYLAGEAVAFGDIDVPDSVAPPLAELGLADAPDASRIGWLEGRRKVPLEVAATGPKVIALAACVADRVMFALGADPERVGWGISLARQARADAGLDPDGVEFGAYVNAVCHSDLETARELSKGGLTTFARFAVMHGTVAGPISPAMADAMQSLRRAYDMNKHTQAGSSQAATLTPEFIDAYAVVGPPDHCIERIGALAKLGLSKLAVSGNLHMRATPEGQEAQALMASAVLPATQAL